MVSWINKLLRAVFIQQFEGPGNDQLYVTSAHCGANNVEENGLQSTYPDSGHLFVVNLAGKYRGLPRHSFAG